MKRFSILFLFLLLIFASAAKAQQAKADSLYKVYLKATADTSKINLLTGIFNAYAEFNAVKGLSFAREALELSERSHYDRGVCIANHQIGDYYYDQLNYAESLRHYLLASVAGENQKMFAELSVIYNKIGIIYSNQKKNDISLKYFLKVVNMAELQKKPKRLAIAYNNIGIAYKDLGRYTEAKEYYQKALDAFEKTDFKRGIASVNNGLGTLSHILHNDEDALKYYQNAIENFKAIKDTAAESGIMTNIGEVYNDGKQYPKALDFYLKGLKVAEHYKNTGFRADAYDGLSKVYANMKNYERAFYYKNRYLALKDSISDEDGMRQVQEMEKRLDNEKQEKEIEILKQKQEIQDLQVKTQSQKLKQNRIVIYSVAGILLVVLAMSFFLFKTYKQVQKANVELAEKKKEIQDSINYARNIQQAMLPEVSVLSRYFPEGFGLYLPKDVVSGDFYWFNELNGLVYFAAADCTGHGVPGAFMSMIGIDKLNQSLIDKRIENLSDILSFLNVSIKKALKQHNDTSVSKDGMDIAICSFDSKSKILNYAGANRPLWVLRANEIIEYKPTKASIAGFTDDVQVYNSHRIQLQEHDIIYVFSDGFADQFGGANKKKFMTKQLKQTLIDIHTIPMHQQEIKLQGIFNDWKGTLDQVDDVILLGMKI